MKRILLSLIALYSVVCFGQKPISAINISLPAQPAASTAAWASAVPPFMITAQARLVNGRVDSSLSECRILVTIKSGGSKICGSYTPQTAPRSNFNGAVKNWTGAAAVALLGQECTLSPGTYELCVQFYGRIPSPVIETGLLGEACKSFTIADTKQQSFIPPVNLVPEDGKTFTQQEADLPILLRWTPVSPRPKEDVVYKVRVIEILPGQNKTEALRNNTPLDILEVKNNTQVSYRLGKRITGLYWEVEAESAQRVQGEKPRNYGKSEATSIKIGGAEHKNDWPQKSEVYNPPVNQIPVDGKIFTKEEAARPINLKWIPVQPKPQRPVNYKVTIKQIEKGQTPAQAMKANKAMDVLEVKDETQTTYKLAQRTNGIGYVWNVQASKTNQMGDVEMLGTSEATAFSVAGNCGIELLNLKVDCDSIVNGMQRYKICMDIKNVSDQDLIFNNPGNNATTNPYINPSFVGAIAGINTTGNFPFFPTVGTITGATYPNLLTVGSLNNFCFYYTPPGAGTYYFAATAKSQSNNLCTAWDSIKLVLEPCKCNLCDQTRWILPESIKYDTSWRNGTNNILSVYGGLSFGPYKPIKISAELVDFYWYTEGDCKKCNNNDYYFGNLISGSLSGYTSTNVADENGIPLINSHQIDFLSPTLAGNTVNNLPMQLNISLPPETQLSCCTDCFRFCIRYTATFMENGVCKTCSIVKCYESKRKHRVTGLQQWPQPNQCGDIVFPTHGGGPGGVLINGTKQN